MATKTKSKKPNKWIQKATKNGAHKGIEKAKAKRAGRSLHAQLEKDSHSKNPSVRGRGLLGLRFQGEHGGVKGRKKTSRKRKTSSRGYLKSARKRSARK